MWIWQKKKWPELSYNAKAVLPILEQTVRVVSPLCLLARKLNRDKQLYLESKVLLSEALSSAKIEGETLDRESVRSSIANRLGIGKVKKVSKSESAYIDILLESIRESNQPLTEKQLLKWHHTLFSEHSSLYEITAGDYRNESMSVVSGRYGKETVHFKAPCSTHPCVKEQMEEFLYWLNQSEEQSGYIKSAIAKFWFVTIHPFDDGNGRFSRMIAERLLAESENETFRLYSISSQIEKNRNEYYEILEQCQKGNLDITAWIIWFLKQVTNAAQDSMKLLASINYSTNFWDNYRHINFNARQNKFLIHFLDNRLEDEDRSEGITRKRYKKLLHISDVTATRDLQNLVELGVLQMSGAGRSVRYTLTELLTNST